MLFEPEIGLINSIDHTFNNIWLLTSKVRCAKSLRFKFEAFNALQLHLALQFNSKILWDLSHVKGFFFHSFNVKGNCKKKIHKIFMFKIMLLIKIKGFNNVF
jgi:hypothetical protein